MTSAQVNGANTGLMEFMSMVQTSQLTTDTTQDFSKIMELKSNANDVTDVDMSVKSSGINETDSTKETTIQTRDNDQSLKPVDEEETMESIEGTVEEVKAEIAEELDITVEELEQAMQSLGMSDLSLLDVTNLPTLFAEVIGEEPITILTDSELSGTLNELIQLVNESNSNLANELNVMPEEIVKIVNEMEAVDPENLQNMEMQIVDGTEIATEQNVVSSEQVASVEVASEGDVEQNEARVMFGNEQEVVVSISDNQNAGDTSNHDSHGSLGSDTNTFFEQTEDVNVNANVVQEFAEQIMTNIEDAVAEVTYTTETVDAEGIMKQIVNHVKVGVSSEVTSMELQLQPENLGKLDLQVALKDGKLVAEFTTENEAVKNVIEGQLIHLKETLEEQGLKVSSVEVSVEQQSLQQNEEQNQSDQSEYQEAGKQNVRKINLQGIRSLEEIEFEELNEDELMTAQLMLQNGNTVDFTA